VLFLIALVGAAIVALVLWRTMNTVRADAPGPVRAHPSQPARPRVHGPDDDPDFLRQLGENLRRREDPPTS